MTLEPAGAVRPSPPELFQSTERPPRLDWSPRLAGAYQTGLKPLSPLGGVRLPHALGNRLGDRDL